MMNRQSIIYLRADDSDFSDTDTKMEQNGAKDSNFEQSAKPLFGNKITLWNKHHGTSKFNRKNKK